MADVGDRHRAEARVLLTEMGLRMAGMGVVTTAHFDAGLDALAAALARAEAEGVARGLERAAAECERVGSMLVTALERGKADGCRKVFFRLLGMAREAEANLREGKSDAAQA